MLLRPSNRRRNLGELAGDGGAELVGASSFQACELRRWSIRHALLEQHERADLHVLLDVSPVEALW